MKKTSPETAGEPLEKRSKNVREKTRNITPQQAHQRIMNYIRRKGFRAYPGRQDRFGIGKDQREISYSQNAGSPDHELGHALMTPEGSTIREYQQALGQVTSKVGMPEEQRRAEEMAAFGMQPSIRRRAGVYVGRGPFEYHARHPEARAKYEEGRARGKAKLDAFDEGRLTIDGKGKVVRGNSIFARINERAMKKSEGSRRPTQPQWLGRPILHEDHLQDLETRAAINEFHHRMPRAHAEQAAHDDYVREQRERAAAHHLAGMKASMATGNHEDARKHWVLYDIHLKALGKESIGAIPPEIERRMAEEGGQKPVYRFKAHKGDLYALHAPTQDQAWIKFSNKGPIQKAEAKQCKWRLGERRCKRMVTTKYCHDHVDHWANKIKQRESETEESLEKSYWRSKDGIRIPKAGTPAREQWDKDYQDSIVEYFGNGNPEQLRPVTLDPNDEAISNMNSPVNEARVNLYTRMARAGDPLPPVIVRRSGTGWYLVDGNHRQEAAKRAKLPQLTGYEIVPLKGPGRR